MKAYRVTVRRKGRNLPVERTVAMYDPKSLPEAIAAAAKVIGRDLVQGDRVEVRTADGYKVLLKETTV